MMKFTVDELNAAKTDDQQRHSFVSEETVTGMANTIECVVLIHTEFFPKIDATQRTHKDRLCCDGNETRA